MKSGCFSNSQPTFYTTLKPGDSTTVDDLIVMVRYAGDPYVKAYDMSKDNQNFYNVNSETESVMIVKWMVFLSGVTYLLTNPF